jgi:hypothetical protein
VTFSQYSVINIGSACGKHIVMTEEKKDEINLNKPAKIDLRSTKEVREPLPSNMVKT